MREFQIVRIEANGASDVEYETALTDVSEMLEYIPDAAPVTVTRTKGRREGAWPVEHEIGNVTEAFTIWTLQDPFAAQRALNQAFETALAWGESFRKDMRIVARVRDEERGPGWYEAQLFYGKAEPDMYYRHKMRVTWEREPYWTAVDDVTLPLTNNAGGTDTFATIYNCDDQFLHNNWCTVGAPDGDVPALTRIRIQNTFESDRLAKVVIGWYDRPNALTLEGENSTLLKTIIPNVNYSNQAAANAKVFSWEMPQSSVVDYVGMFNVFASGVLSGTWRISCGYELSRMQKGKTVSGMSGWTDLGVLSLPPGGYTHPVRYPVKIWLDGSQEGMVDFLHFVPIQQFRRLKFIGYNALPGTCIEDDGIRQELAYDYAGQRFPVLKGWGERIMIWPEGMLPKVSSKRQMLTFELTDDGGKAEAMRSAAVQVVVRPRWNVLP